MTRAQAEYRRVRYADAIAARNARLAEQQVRDAAPDLLACLEMIWAKNGSTLTTDEWSTIRRAIAKAGGRAAP